jgi:hypothetical protein
MRRINSSRVRRPIEADEQSNLRNSMCLAKHVKKELDASRSPQTVGNKGVGPLHSSSLGAACRCKAIGFVAKARISHATG